MLGPRAFNKYIYIYLRKVMFAAMHAHNEIMTNRVRQGYNFICSFIIEFMLRFFS